MENINPETEKNYNLISIDNHSNDLLGTQFSSSILKAKEKANSLRVESNNNVFKNMFCYPYEEDVSKGLDFILFQKCLKLYLLFPIIISFTYVLCQIPIMLVINGQNFDFSWNPIELGENYSRIYLSSAGYQNLIFDFFRILIFLLIIFYIKTVSRKIIKKYNKKIEELNYLDESLFTMMIKNVPDIPEDEIKTDLLDKIYNCFVVKIIKLHIPNEVLKINSNLEILTKIKTVKSLKGEDSKNEESRIEILENKLDEQLSFPVFSGTVLVIFEHIAAKVTFYEHTKQSKCTKMFKIAFCCCNKYERFRNKNIYFEMAPEINSVDWSRLNYSLYHQLQKFNFIKNWVFQIISIVYCVMSILGVEMLYNLVVDNFGIENEIYFIFVDWGLKIGWFCLNQLTVLTVKFFIDFIFKFSDYKFKSFILDYCSSKKVFLSYIIIANFDMPIGKESQVEYKGPMLINSSIILKCLTVIIYSTISSRYVWFKLKCFFLRTNPENAYTQSELDDIYENPEFRIIRVFQCYRLLMFLVLTYLTIYPLTAFLFFILMIAFLFISKFALYYSSYKKSIIYFDSYIISILNSEFYGYPIFIFCKYVGFFNIKYNLPKTNGMISFVLLILFGDFDNLIVNKITSVKVVTNQFYNDVKHNFRDSWFNHKYVNFNLLKINKFKKNSIN